jgi:hypothetical protein
MADRFQAGMTVLITPATNSTPIHPGSRKFFQNKKNARFPGRFHDLKAD